MKVSRILIFICCLFVLCGCSKESDEIETITDDTNIKDVSEGIDFGDVTYNPETDGQCYFDVFTQYVSVGSGYYTFYDKYDGCVWLSYIDRESEECVPVCSNPDCSHDSKDCDACFDERVDIINYYNGSLYTMLYEIDSREGTVVYYLYKVSLDGSKREKVFEMYSTTVNSAMPRFTLHRGYIYYQVQNGEYTCLYARNLNGGEPELIYKDKAEEYEICTFSGYSDGLMFSTQCGGSYRILYYSRNSRCIYKIADECHGLYAAADNYLIYRRENELIKVNLQNMVSETLAQNIVYSSALAFDGKYIYIDNINSLYDKNDFTERRVDIYDISGKKIDTLDLPGSYATLDICDGDIIFMRGNSSKILYINKKQIGTEKHEWTELPIRY